jgi:hypothetical protein
MASETSCDISPQRMHAQVLPDEARCVAWRKNCACGHKFPRSDLYGGKGKNTRREGPPPPCPECGRPRERCHKAKMKGFPTCRNHGAKGIAKRAFIPGYINLDDEEILTLQELMVQDDTSLMREFHMLRLLFGRAIEQFQNASLKLGGDCPVDLIGELRRLAGIIDRLSAIAERRAKARLIVPPEEQVVRVEFNDPRVQYFIKEAFRDTEIKTIKRVLAVVLQYADPKGELGISKKIPPSLFPYLPSAGEHSPESPKSIEGSKP